jgi:hypothetical protein
MVLLHARRCREGQFDGHRGPETSGRIKRRVEPTPRGKDDENRAAAHKIVAVRRIAQVASVVSVGAGVASGGAGRRQFTPRRLNRPVR